jgi:mycothiol synthase
METRSREYRGEEDYERIRRLLVECYAINGTMHCWGLERLDWWRFNTHAYDELSGSRGWQEDVRLWETKEGKLIGVAHPEDGLQPGRDYGDVFLEIHPDYRYLEDEMFSWVEEHHVANRPDDATVWPLKASVYDYDRQRAELLTRRGYRYLGPGGYKRRCSLTRSIPTVELPPGYGIRAVDESEMEAWADVVGAAFNNLLNSAERCRVWLDAPTNRLDLDLVVVAPDGTFGAFCIAWFDEENRIGVFEPVGTHPAHRRRGLGKAVMSEGLRRLQALGATVAYVGVGTGVAANRLYESVGFMDYDVECCWQKEY